jgi:ribosome-associated toxin RatA of RatAB toxin-antitoxin module
LDIRFDPCRLLSRGFARGWILVLLVGGLASSVAAEEAPLSANVRAGGIDTSQREQAGSRIHRARAVGLVKAPVDKVMQVVLDYGNYQRFMPKFVVSRVLSRRGDQALIYVEVTALNGLAKLWAEMRVRMLPSQDPTRVVLARMIKGNLRQFEAEWLVKPIDAAQTLVTFEMCADPDLPLPFGSGIVSDNNEKEARRSIVGLRTYMTKRGLVAAR